MVSGNQHHVRPELHLVLHGNSAPRVQPTARANVDVAANFQATRKVDGHPPRHLQISPACLERGPEQKSTRAENGPQVRQPVCRRHNEMEPEILEQSHFLRSYSCGTAAFAVSRFGPSSLSTVAINRSSVCLRAASNPLRIKLRR